MIFQWKLPDVGEGIHEAEIVRWRVREGDRVEQDQILLEVQTDKATVEIPSPVAGTIVKLHGAEGQIVPVGTVLVEIETEQALRTGAAPSGASPQAAAEGPRVAPSDGGARSRVKAAPAVRRLARELGVDLGQVTGTGPEGRVTEEDVRAFARRAASPVQAPPEMSGFRTTGTDQRAPEEGEDPEERIPLRGVRRVIAEHMVRSKFTIPHVTGMDEADVTDLVEWRRRAEEAAAAEGVRLTYLPFVVKAVVSALRAYPYFNASLDEQRGEIVLKKAYHIGIAVDAPDGLVVPVIRHADRKSLMELARDIEELKQKARTRSLTPREMQGGTFTISNIGSFGGMFATPVIHYPQVAILATGRVVRRPVILDDDRVVGRYMMPLSITFDHRIIDGALSGRFMAHVIRLLQNPVSLLLSG
ncbi:MAG: dihydrolipoamide acetyltransferase family protein [Alicyclobacillaceae bacterium]|nr:dihydrolipoamide acetyltransferase family protein [Alicyclobacillaceae bacterium]